MPRPQPWLQSRLSLALPFARDFTHRSKLKLFSFAHYRRYFWRISAMPLFSDRSPVFTDRRAAPFPFWDTSRIYGESVNMCNMEQNVF
jgi:hypothetical protein